MPACLDALHDDAVRACVRGRPGLLRGSALVHPDAAGRPARRPPERHDHVRLLRNVEMRAPGERQQHVDRHGTRTALAVDRELRAQRRRRHDAELTETAGLRDRDGQLRAREAATEPCADDRVRQPEPLAKAHSAILLTAWASGLRTGSDGFDAIPASSALHRCYEGRETVAKILRAVFDVLEDLRLHRRARRPRHRRAAVRGARRGPRAAGHRPPCVGTRPARSRSSP